MHCFFILSINEVIELGKILSTTQKVACRYCRLFGDVSETYKNFQVRLGPTTQLKSSLSGKSLIELFHLIPTALRSIFGENFGLHQASMKQGAARIVYESLKKSFHGIYRGVDLSVAH